MSDTHGIQRRLASHPLDLSRLKLPRLHLYLLLAILLILVVQRVGSMVLGAGYYGALFADGITIFSNCLGIGAAILASRRGRDAATTFWFLLASALTLQLVGNAGWAWFHYFQIAVPDSALFPSLFYRFSVGPMAIALFLSEGTPTSRLESLLDNCMIVGLVGLTTYQVQMAELNPHDPKIWQLISIGACVNILLVGAAAIRFLLEAPGSLRSLFARQSTYLAIYGCVSLITSLADAYFPQIESSVDSLWILPYLAAAALAFTWRPSPAHEAAFRPKISRRASLLCFNLTLAVMVLSSAALGFRLVNATRVIGLVAVSLVLIAFAVRSALMQDIQEKYLQALQESRAQLERQALYDELTGLANRRLLFDQLTKVLAQARRQKQLVALLCLDLDGFKPVNDRLGHWVGDILLRQVAARMLTRVRKSDTLARMGGDEFTWLASPISTKEQAAQLGKEMLATLSQPFEIEGNLIHITASIGIGMYPAGATDAETLIQQADRAMYAVKHNGKDGVILYSLELDRP